MRVAIVTGGYFPVPPTKGGAVETLVEYIIQQNETKHELDLVVYSCDDADARRESQGFSATEFRFVDTPALLRAGDRIVYFLTKNVLRKKKHMSYRYILQRLHFIRSVGKSLAQEGFDRVVFENHPTLLGALDVSSNSEHYADKCIYHMHNVFGSFFGRKEELLSCRRVLGVSNYTLEGLKKLSQGEIDDSKLKVLRNRVDENVFTGNISPERAQELRQRHSIPDGAKVVLFGGRLTWEKGALELIEAFGKLGDVNAVLLVVGAYYYGSQMKSEYEERLEAAAKSLGGRIVFTGFVAHDEMPDYYALADVVCAPSVASDSAPLAVIEPLTAGRPVVTTRIGGIPEYATDGVDSVVLPLGEGLEDRLAAAIRGVLSGEVRLGVNEAESWDIASFYTDFVRLVSE